MLPEGTEPRTAAAPPSICHELGIARCVLLGAPGRGGARRPPGSGSTLPAGLEVVDPAAVAETYVDALVEPPAAARA